MLGGASDDPEHEAMLEHVVPFLIKLVFYKAFLIRVRLTLRRGCNEGGVLGGQGGDAADSG